MITRRCTKENFQRKSFQEDETIRLRLLQAGTMTFRGRVFHVYLYSEPK